MNVISMVLSLRTADRIPTDTGGDIVAGATIGLEPQGIAGGGVGGVDAGGAFVGGEALGGAGAAGACGATAVLP